MPYVIAGEGVSHFFFAPSSIISAFVRHDANVWTLLTPMADLLCGVLMVGFGWLLKEEDEDELEEKTC